MSKDLLNSIKEEIYKEEIKKIAYYLWQEAGCPENKDLEFWLLAEKKHKLLSTFESKQSKEIAQFKRISIPLIRRIYPKLLSTLFSQNYLLTEEDIKNLKKNEP